MLVEEQLSEGIVVPSSLNRDVGNKVVPATALAAMETGVARDRPGRADLEARIKVRFDG
jgi:hypothetical protein